MKILSSQQKRTADKFSIKNEPISSIDLMERAAKACVSWILKNFSEESKFQVFCGTGNNGGDGLAIARLLIAENYKVEVSIIRFSENDSKDFVTNLERLKKLSIETEDYSESDKINIKSGYILIDALLGSGLNKQLKGLLKQSVQELNASGKFIISIDVPAGLFMDTMNQKDQISIEANVSLTFQTPPHSFFISENANRVGDWKLLDIGLDKRCIEDAESTYNYIQPQEISEILQPRQKHNYKGSFGHALMVAGSKTKGGAAILSAKAAMRSGVGLLTMGIPD